MFDAGGPCNSLPRSLNAVESCVETDALAARVRSLSMSSIQDLKVTIERECPSSHCHKNECLGRKLSILGFLKFGNSARFSPYNATAKHTKNLPNKFQTQKRRETYSEGDCERLQQPLFHLLLGGPHSSARVRQAHSTVSLPSSCTGEIDLH